MSQNTDAPRRSSFTKPRQHDLRRYSIDNHSDRVTGGLASSKNNPAPGKPASIRSQHPSSSRKNRHPDTEMYASPRGMFDFDFDSELAEEQPGYSWPTRASDAKQLETRPYSGIQTPELSAGSNPKRAFGEPEPSSHLDIHPVVRGFNPPTASVSSTNAAVGRSHSLKSRPTTIGFGTVGASDKRRQTISSRSKSVVPVAKSKQPADIDHQNLFDSLEKSNREQQALQELADEYKARLQDLEAKHQRVQIAFGQLEKNGQSSAGDDRTSPGALRVIGKVIEELETQLTATQTDLDKSREGNKALKDQLQQEGINLSQAKERIKQLKSENKHLTVTINELEKGVIDSKNSRSQIERISEAITRCSEDLSAMQRVLSENTQNVEVYSEFYEANEGYPDEIVTLRIRLLEIFGIYTAKYDTLEQQNDLLSRELAALKFQLREQEFKHSKDHRPPITRGPSNDSFDTDETLVGDSWEKLYEEKSAAHAKLQKRHEQLWTRIQQDNVPELKRAIEDLTSRLSEETDRYDTAVADRDSCKFQAENWQDEADHFRSRCESYESEYEAQFLALQQEKCDVVADYYAKLPETNPDWYTISSLQKQICEAERELARRQKENLRLSEERDTAIREFQDLRAVMEQGRSVRYAAYPWQSSSPTTDAKRPIPLYQTESETLQRVTMIEELAKKLKKQYKHHKDRQREALVDQARMHLMGDHYPPKKAGYKALAKQTPAERWEMRRYYEYASPAEQKDIERLGLVKFA